MDVAEGLSFSYKNGSKFGSVSKMVQDPNELSRSCVFVTSTPNLVTVNGVLLGNIL